MDDRQREFLDALLDTASPSGFETRCQRVWIDHVIEFADEVSTDAYGNAVATYNGAPRSDADSSEGSGTAPSIAFAGHADEIGLIARDIDDEGFCRLGAIGGADRTVSQGQHVRIHTDGPDGSDASDGSEEPASIPGVIGQTAIHLRERADDSLTDVSDQYVDIGTENREETTELVDVGDPITFATETENLAGARMAARGMDNRIGIWAAAEGLRAAAAAKVDATVHAVSTIQEEVGLKGARMVGFELAPDAVVAVDVTHATDHPESGTGKAGSISLGAGPVISRGSTNHPGTRRSCPRGGDRRGNGRPTPGVGQLHGDGRRRLLHGARRDPGAVGRAPESLRAHPRRGNRHRRPDGPGGASRVGRCGRERARDVRHRHIAPCLNS
jgi:endoglucanase